MTTKRIEASDVLDLLPKDLQEWGAPRPENEAASSSYDELHECAAVLAFFDEGIIKAFGHEHESEDANALFADSILLSDQERQQRWMMMPEVRREVLRQLGSRDEMVRALERVRTAVPGLPAEPLQEMLEAYLRGTAPSLERQDAKQLELTARVIEWLPASLEGLPDRGALTSRIELIHFLQPLRDLVGTHFRGREAQLRELRDYVGVIPGTPLSKWAETVRRFLSLHEKPPLMIYGPGGVGKSTLLARFILEHADAADADRFPLVYIDFDRPGLRAEEPVTVLVEAVRQLGLQFPKARLACEKIRKEWLRRLADLAGSARPRAGVLRVGSRLSGARERGRFFSDFQNLMKTMGLSDSPFLLILDTFEEVQYRSQSASEEIWAFLNELQGLLPRLRSVLSGRAPLMGFKTRELEIPPLEPEAGQAILEHQGIPAKDAEFIVKKFGTNPLTLRLACELFQAAGARGFAEIETRDWLFRKIKESRIQGEFFMRILGHIHDDDVRKLAHPGLILRRITPDLISEVLAEPCGVKIPNPRRAEELFEELRREVSLVRPDDDGSLRHRSDIRRVMISLLREDEPERVILIHQRAVAYYEKRQGVIERAEEIYHRLSLRQDAETVSARWMEGVGPYLSAALEELGPVECAYLATRLGNVELPPEVRERAQLDDWERHTERRVLELLGLGDPEKALRELQGRKDRLVGSRLYLAEAFVQARLGRWEEARGVAQRGIESVAEEGDVLLLCDLLLMRALACLRLGRLEEGRESLGEVEQLVQRRIEQGRAGDAFLRRFATTLLIHLGLVRQNTGPQSSEAESLRGHLLQAMGLISDGELVAEPELSRRAALEARPEDRLFLARMLGLCRPKLPGYATLSALARALSLWDEEVSKKEGQSPGMLARELDHSENRELFNTWEALLLERGTARAVDAVIPLLQKYQPTQLAVDALLEVCRATPLETQSAYSILALMPEGVGRKSREDSAPLLDVPSQNRSSTPSKGHPVDLSGLERKVLVDALIKDFDQESLRQMLHFRVGRSLAAISFGRTLTHTVYDLVKTAEDQGWIAELVTAARESRPSNAELQALASSIGLAPALPPQLERIVTSKGPFLDINSWRARLGEIQARVCRVERGQRPIGTGFLVGPDTVMTAAHAVHDWLEHQVRPEDLLFRFDFTQSQDGATLNSGTVYRVAEKGLLERSDDLDYVLLRVTGAPGVEPVGGNRSEALAPRRGWMEIADQPLQLSPGEPMLVAQHPLGGPLKISMGNVVGISADGAHIRYDANTEPGSSGAPCFTADLRLVGLHSQVVEGDRRIKEGTSTEAILRRLQERGQQHLIGERSESYRR